VTIGQPLTISIADTAPSVLAFSASQMVDRSTADGFSSIIALAGEINLIDKAVFLYTERV
jgi:hypothetical protein